MHAEARALALLGANLLHHLAVASSRWNPGLPRSESHMGSTRSKGTEMSDGMVRRYASRFTAASDSPDERLDVSKVQLEVRAVIRVTGHGHDLHGAHPFAQGVGLAAQVRVSDSQQHPRFILLRVRSDTALENRTRRVGVRRALRAPRCGAPRRAGSRCMRRSSPWGRAEMARRSRSSGDFGTCLPASATLPRMSRSAVRIRAPRSAGLILVASSLSAFAPSELSSSSRRTLDRRFGFSNLGRTRSRCLSERKRGPADGTASQECLHGPLA